MIIKNMDEFAAELATIERLLLSDPTPEVATALQQDRSTILGSLQHKRDAAYHLDFYFTDTPDWVVIHDLRLEMGDTTAMFDHLLISRGLDIYVIESKYYNNSVRISEDGEFGYYVDNHPVVAPSPAERNRKNIEFLNNYLLKNGLLPTRFGLAIKPNFHNIVLVSPTSSVQLPRRDVDLGYEVVRSDYFLERFSPKLPSGTRPHDFVALARHIPTENLITMGNKLARRHMPRRIDLSRQYGVEHKIAQHRETADSVEQCASCHKPITARVVRYCYDNRELFAGKAYCFDCQKGIAFQAVM
jgi:hypothetical protein